MPSLPEVNDTFEWREQPWGPALTCGALGKVARHLFSSRHLQLSSLTGWTSVAASMGVAAGCVFRLKQVHGTSVVVVPRGERTPPWEPADGDALISDDPSVALVVRTADCAPILLADGVTGAVGAVHAGWRGTAAGVVASTVTAMGLTFGTK